MENDVQKKDNPAPESAPRNKQNIIVMIAVIVMFLIGIIFRWDFVKKEMSETFRNLFRTEQKD